MSSPSSESTFVKRVQRERQLPSGADHPVPTPRGNPPAEALLDPMAELDYPKYYDRNEVRNRAIVARIATLALPVFLLSAAYSACSHRAFNPIGISSHFWIDLARLLFPDAYLLSVMHNTALAATAAWFLLITTVGHVDPPGDPRRVQTVVWRRQTRRVAIPKWLAAFALASMAVAVSWKGYKLLALFLEAPATGFALYAAAQQWVSARQFVSVETFPKQEGMANQVRVGGGKRGALAPTETIGHANLIRAARVTCALEFMLGISGLQIYYVDDRGQRRSITVRGLGSHQLVETIAAYLNGPFKIARPPGTLPPNFPLWGGEIDPHFFLPPPQVRRIALWPW
jgi:hypothetical protein